MLPGCRMKFETKIIERHGVPKLITIPMKKISLFFASALIVSAFFTGCNQKSGATASAADSTGVAASAAIAYVNIDTLVAHYDMYTELSGAFQEKSGKAETELTNRGRSLEKDMMGYQEKVQKGLVTRIQAQSIEEDLQRKQQSFLQHRDQIVGQLAEEEQVMLNQIHYSIVDFLKEFNKDGRYGMIISSNTAGPVLNASPSLDITKQVIEGINKSYAANKGKDKK